MRRYSIVLASAALCFFLGTLSGSAQDTKDTSSQESLPWYNPKKYNPLKLMHRGPQSANDQLASNGDLEVKLTHQLQVQGFLPQDKNLQYACSGFKYLDDCVASVRVSRSLKIEFTCLKWDVTGVKPKPVADSCAGPAGGKAMLFHKAIDLLKPDSNARVEAREALKKARDDIKDAGGEPPATSSRISLLLSCRTAVLAREQDRPFPFLRRLLNLLESPLLRPMNRSRMLRMNNAHHLPQRPLRRPDIRIAPGHCRLHRLRRVTFPMHARREHPPQLRHPFQRRLDLPLPIRESHLPRKTTRGFFLHDPIPESQPCPIP